METVCVKVVGGYLYDSFCGSGKLFLPHKNSSPRYHPMVFTLFMTVFVGQEMIIFSAPQRPGPKISQRALNPELFPEKWPQPVLPRVNATLMLGSSLWGRK